jgi:hypothetical protein
VAHHYTLMWHGIGMREVEGGGAMFATALVKTKGREGHNNAHYPLTTSSMNCA